MYRLDMSYAKPVVQSRHQICISHSSPLWIPKVAISTLPRAFVPNLITASWNFGEAKVVRTPETGNLESEGRGWRGAEEASRRLQSLQSLTRPPLPDNKGWEGEVWVFPLPSPTLPYSLSGVCAIKVMKNQRSQSKS